MAMININTDTPTLIAIVMPQALVKVFLSTLPDGYIQIPIIKPIKPSKSPNSIPMPVFDSPFVAAEFCVCAGALLTAHPQWMHTAALSLIS